MNTMTLTPIGGEPRVDSRVIADQLGVKRKNTRQLVEQYQSDFEQLGQLPFETEVGKRAQGGGNPEKYALLNEDQAYLLLTYSQNTPQARALKIRLVRAFGDYRRGAVPPAIKHPLPDIPLVRIDGEPRIADLTLADYLGFPYPARIRPLIRRNLTKLQRFGICATVAQIHPGAGRPTNAYYLNQKQAVWVCDKVDPSTVSDVQVGITQTFDAYLLEPKPYLLPQPDREAQR